MFDSDYHYLNKILEISTKIDFKKGCVLPIMDWNSIHGKRRVQVSYGLLL